MTLCEQLALRFGSKCEHLIYLHRACCFHFQTQRPNFHGRFLYALDSVEITCKLRFKQEKYNDIWYIFIFILMKNIIARRIFILLPFLLPQIRILRLSLHNLGCISTNFLVVFRRAAIKSTSQGASLIYIFMLHFNYETPRSRCVEQQKKTRKQQKEPPWHTLICERWGRLFWAQRVACVQRGVGVPLRH